REPDAGVAARPLDHGLPRLQPARPFGILDHAQRQAVLHGTARVERLDLHVQLDPGRGESVDADDRRAADRLDDARVSRHVRALGAVVSPMNGTRRDVPGPGPPRRSGIPDGPAAVAGQTESLWYPGRASGFQAGGGAPRPASRRAAARVPAASGLSWARRPAPTGLRRQRRPATGIDPN